jgi:hypothetical protein
LPISSRKRFASVVRSATVEQAKKFVLADRDSRAPDGRGVARPVQADQHVTSVLCSGTT